MSRRDRTTGAARPWRLFGRALVVAGATVAGTSAAWLLGHGPADAADLPAAEDAAERPAAEAQEGDQPGPTDFSLTRLDPLRLVSSGPAGKLLDAAQPVTDAAQPVTEVLRQPAAEVGQVAGEALEVTETQTSAPAPVAADGPEAPPQPPAETGPPPLVVPPPAVESPAQDVTEPVRAPRPSQPLRLEPPAPEPPAQPSAPTRSAPFVLPAPPGAPGFGSPTDGPHHNTTALGWYPAAPVRVPAFAGAPACDLAGTPVGVPEPQPGTTPD